jgi:hypothetical protein
MSSQNGESLFGILLGGRMGRAVIFQNSSTTVLGDFVGRLEDWALQNAAATKTKYPNEPN